MTWHHIATSCATSYLPLPTVLPVAIRFLVFLDKRVSLFPCSSTLQFLRSFLGSLSFFCCCHWITLSNHSCNFANSISEGAIEITCMEIFYFKLLTFIERWQMSYNYGDHIFLDKTKDKAAKGANLKEIHKDKKK